ncbi:MAG: polyhydroxyalkanoic acid system family protein [Phenylobacterium sp.]|jgi:putative polyhydroxyalkanoate system protein|uniref:polyhydroxyalkanoic acid system family protein n=1 Tax=Phenylobacterium sp. TaxID=1871053 RepID=UPI00391CA2AC
MAKPIVVDIPHELGRAEARKRIEDGLARIGKQFGEGVKLTKTWEGDRLNFAAKVVGQSVAGRLDVLEEAVRMEVDLPPFFAMIADKVKGRLQKEGQLMLEKK